MGLMYLRESKQRRADGSVVTYLQLAENVWDATKGRSQASIVHNCGRADDPDVVERLRRLAKSILRRCSPEEIVGAGGDWRLICAWPYGDVYVLETLWKQLGIDAIVRQQAGTRHFGFDVERAMDFLEANKDAIEAAIFHRVADLLNLDVDVVFYDTTSLHFEIDDEDTGDKNGNVRGSEVSGKTYTAPRQRGHSKNGRGDAPQIVVGMAVTLTAEDMALGYKQQQRVEEAWRTMKSGLKMRPVFHWAPHRIHAHIAITVLSLLLERTAEYACQDTWRNIRDDLKQVQRALLSSPNGRVWQVTEPSPSASNRLKALKIKPPKPILNLD
ncbi:hypothetical protein [Propionivibrio sp.]|uniref:hypothetical protein n=1 Tax=Propionivibrio sp. TaxID=2212460 RepID=UPI0025F845E0|nr:hypothetical protein [Propionivibrio sp.]